MKKVLFVALFAAAAMSLIVCFGVDAQTKQQQKAGVSYCYRSEGVLRCKSKKPDGIPEDKIRKITYSFMETKWVPVIYRCIVAGRIYYTQTPAIGCIVVGFDETE